MADWMPLISSNLVAYAYDEAKHILQVKFKNGRTYSYEEVPPAIVEGLSTAASAGKFFNDHIKFSFYYYQ